MDEHIGYRISRRGLLSSVAMACLVGGSHRAFARSHSGELPFRSFAADPPAALVTSSWIFFAPEEARAIEAMVDRLIPADDLSVGGKEAGCAVFIDRQLAGPFGRSSRLYTTGPFLPGLPTQGYQGEMNPAQRYRANLAAIDTLLKTTRGKGFIELALGEQDAVLADMEAGRIELPDPAGGAKGFFALLLQNTMEGFFADPIYGGNRDMASWKMLGFPGARYDYRDHVTRHNERYALPPVSIAGASDWSTK